MPAGTPRTISFKPHEMESLGKEMIEWLQINEKKVLHLSEWYTIHKGFTYNEWKTFIQRDEFIPYYEQALKIVGRKYLDKTSDVREGISQRWQRVYFKDLRDEEDESLQRKIDKELEQKKKILDHQSKNDREDSLTPEQIKKRKEKISNAY